ncbi:hypothetical protein G8A07_11025 [Roseateles sp. DAIF2]|uniref:DUF5908 family protein n=1 Tax=Roseateles sp. DAIF2 TaxID=2714952 RepID=UPI0018A31C80|nr:DUF5908 family protein [Roseateles sp. DAIF2]QPF73397.1 hypothetical protein G8A07_11025 [Roseateles sp. DAIF2]
MPLEIRQLLLDTEIARGRQAAEADDEDEEPEDDDCCGDGDGKREQLKQDILAECRVWLLEQLQQLKER